MGDRRKLLETAQDVLNEPHKDFPKAFWEIFGKRCIQTVHLFDALELAIIARTFDQHNVQMRNDLDVYGAIARQAKGLERFSGLAIVVLADVLSRRLKNAAELHKLLELLGRHAADSMWELSPAHAVTLLSLVNAAGVQDAALSSRVARKVIMQLGIPEGLPLRDLSTAASTFAGQGHRDLELFQAIADSVAALSAESPVGAQAAKDVIDSFDVLGIDSVPEALQRAASGMPQQESYVDM